MATQPDVPPDTIEPGSPPELVPVPNEAPPEYAPQEQPELPPDIDQPGIGPEEVPVIE